MFGFGLLTILMFFAWCWLDNVFFGKRNDLGKRGMALFLGCVGVWLFLIYAFFIAGSNYSPPSNPNAGYMTLDDDKLMTTIELKKQMGQSVSSSEQQFLDAAKTGKFGKPYEDRPKKD